LTDPLFIRDPKKIGPGHRGGRGGGGGGGEKRRKRELYKSKLHTKTSKTACIPLLTLQPLHMG
jgi:hypothetical protein